mgnify:CR=1 FL=1
MSTNSELLESYIAVLAENTYMALMQSQTALQIILNSNVASEDDIKNMKQIVEANSIKLKTLRSAIDSYNKEKSKVDDFENLFKKMLNNRDSMTEEEKERLCNYLPK